MLFRYFGISLCSVLLTVLLAVMCLLALCSHISLLDVIPLHAAPGKAAGSSSNRINGGTLATNSRQPVDNRPAAVGSSHAARISATSAAASNAWMTVDKKGRLRVADSPPPSSSSSPSPTPENGFGRWSSPLAAVSKTKTQAAPTSETAALLEWDDLEAALYSDEQKEQSCG